MLPEYAKRKPLHDNSIARSHLLDRGPSVGYTRFPIRSLPSQRPARFAAGTYPPFLCGQFVARSHYPFDDNNKLSIGRYVSTLP